jgi:predicted flap endonuclease-1-like 5' DNA nuclease
VSQCCGAEGRKRVAEATGLGEAKRLTWANMADLMRISGVGGEFAELLKASGVDTIKELRNRNAENLAQKAQQINEVKKLTRVVPSPAVISGWIEKAKQLDPQITH